MNKRNIKKEFDLIGKLVYAYSKGFGIVTKQLHTDQWYVTWFNRNDRYENIFHASDVLIFVTMFDRIVTDG